MEQAIPQEFDVMFERLVSVLDDYVSGHSAAYDAGITEAADVYVKASLDQLIAHDEIMMVPPSMARWVLLKRAPPDSLQKLGSMRSEIVDSLTEDFEAGVCRHIIDLLPQLSFLGEGRGSNFVTFVLVHAGVTIKQRNKAAPLTSTAALISALQDLSATVIENSAVEAISTIIASVKNSGQGYPPNFGSDALAAIRAIKGSGTPRGEEASQKIERVEAVIVSQLMQANGATTSGPVLH